MKNSISVKINVCLSIAIKLRISIENVARWRSALMESYFWLLMVEKNRRRDPFAHIWEIILSKTFVRLV